MAHFAELDENNIVIDVIVVRNEDMTDSHGIEREDVGVTYLKKLFGTERSWVQTSYNSNFRYNYAAIGYSYDPVNDAFIPPQPFPSWSLDENYSWRAPVPPPKEGILYKWDEDTLSWIKNPYIDIPDEFYE